MKSIHIASKPLVVVESPTKVKTIKKYLGEDYNVAATVGHIKDLPEKEIGIDIENGFKPNYIDIPGKQKIISGLKKAAGKATEIYLAPDPDREGEAIAWHIAEVLQKKGRNFHRVLFHELTQKAILEAIAHPEDLHLQKYEAQKARRILDRLVGYQVSPLLWRKVKGGLSAGRVQSVAVRIICDRERAIQVFEPEEYWSITAKLQAENASPFEAKLVKKLGKKLHIPNEDETKQILNEIGHLPPTVSNIDRRTIKRNPQAPYTTSKLQQESIRRLKFSAKKTMMIAQQLYEGIELKTGESVGLITYMRTDSVRIAKEPAEEALAFIRMQFGPDFAPKAPRYFKNRKKVQDAHEAIRPTSVENTPESLKAHLSKDQLALYRLIWQRFVSSQMTQALIDQISVSIAFGPYVFSASGSSVKFPGFLTVYTPEDEKNDTPKNELPELTQDKVLDVLELIPKQHFTQPPPRFSEASLVKELEENGIGRPSTYATILSTIREKGYVTLEKGYFRPSELGLIVNDLLVENFPDIFNVEFTSKMEDSLDRLEAAEIKALEALNGFYLPFKKELEAAVDQMVSLKGVGISTELTCPKCDSPLKLKVGKNGPFLGCSAYPDCDFTRDYIRDEKGSIKPIEPAIEEFSGKTCPKCASPMVIKPGRYGKFLACSGYPKCEYTESLSTNGSAAGKSTGIRCPEKQCDGEIIQKTSKRGKIFFGCSNYPKCTFATWYKPVDRQCPVCGAPLLVEKSNRAEGRFLACLEKSCEFRELIIDPEPS
jgi:DNA topoisomerase-1